MTPAQALRTNYSIPNVSIAVPIFHVLKLVAVGSANVEGFSDLDSPLALPDPEVWLQLVGDLPVSSLLQISAVDH